MIITPDNLPPCHVCKGKLLNRGDRYSCHCMGFSIATLRFDFARGGIIKSGFLIPSAEDHLATRVQNAKDDLVYIFRGWSRYAILRPLDISLQYVDWDFFGDLEFQLKTVLAFL